MSKRRDVWLQRGALSLWNTCQDRHTEKKGPHADLGLVGFLQTAQQSSYSALPKAAKIFSSAHKEGVVHWVLGLQVANTHSKCAFSEYLGPVSP